MKQRLSLGLLAVLLLATPVRGRPWYQIMDDAEHPPHRYGYHIARVDKDGKSHFTVILDRPAAAALIKPFLFSSIAGGAAPSIDFDRSKIDAAGRNSFHFILPTADLKNFSLRLDSAPVKYCGPSSTIDFTGYDLNLERTPSPSQSEVFITAQKKNGAFEFRILRHPQATIPVRPGMQQLVSACLTGPAEGGAFSVTIPKNSFDDTHITLPAAALPDTVLMVDSAPFGINVTSPQIRTEYFGLGIVAANLEAAEESANADKNPAPPAPTR